MKKHWSGCPTESDHIISSHLVFPDLKAQVNRPLHEDEEFGYLADSTHSTGCEANEFDKNTSADDDATLIHDPDHNISDFSKTTNENTSQFGVHTVFGSFVLNVFFIGDFVPQKAKKVKKACNLETVARQREREEREGFVISAAESMSKKAQRNGISVSPKSYAKFFSEESQKIYSDG